MPLFSYVATNQDGRTISGALTAGSRQELVARLRADNLVLTSISEDSAAAAAAKNARGGSAMETFLHGRIRPADVMVFSRQLAAMLKAGISLTDALQTIATGISNERFRKILMEVRSAVESGNTLTDALRRHPAAFNALFVGVIQAGETSGSLAQNVERLSRYLERQEQFRRKVKAATAYPKFVVGFLVVMVLIIVLWVYPSFDQTFKDLGAKLPPMTDFCLTVSVFLKKHIFLIGAPVVAALFALIFYTHTPRGRYQLQWFLLRVPFVGPMMMKAAFARLTMTLSTLLSNGIPLTDALLYSLPTVNNLVVENGLRNVRSDVMKGVSLAEALNRVQIVPRILVRMVHVGEESGTVAGMLEDVSLYYDQEVEHGLGRVTAVIEPVLVCCMGAIVLVTVLTIYLPIFNLGRAIRGGG